MELAQEGSGHWMRNFRVRKVIKLVKIALQLTWSHTLREECRLRVGYMKTGY